MEKYLIEMQDGRVRIMTLVKGTVEDAYGKWTDKDQIKTVIKINPEDIPKDREFRDAWKNEGNKIGYDLEKARNLRLAQIRLRRKPLLESLDKQFLLALEANDEIKKQEIINKKKELRDITERLKNKTLRDIQDVKDENALFNGAN